MGRWWAGTLVVLLCGAPLFAEQRSAALSSGGRVLLDDDHAIILSVQPHKGDAWSRLALRTTGKAGNWKSLAELNGMQGQLMTERPVRVPLSMAKPELQRLMLRELFPGDRETPTGWVHKVILGGNDGEGESLWRIAEWFTGDGANYSIIKSANAANRLLTKKGDLIVIPRTILSPHFQPAGEGKRPVAEAEDDPAEIALAKSTRVTSRVANQPIPSLTVEASAYGPGVLAYGDAGGRPVAVYRLKKGEALYSSVAIRFTGRVYARDVSEVVDQIVRFNGIENVSRIPAGFPVQIPMELLLPEFRPRNDPRRLEQEESRRESARIVKRVKAKDLKGVHVILDAGHGGRDVGTSHGDIWESDYVYDLVCRLKDLLENKTQARVWVTTRSASSGYRIANANVIPRQTDHIVLTSPSYQLDNPIVGVHLRWYLANSILTRLTRKSVAAEKVVFLSIHADSLHPSLRGAMVYVPGQRFVEGTFSKKEKVYLARAEVRENPTVRQSEDEALLAEGLSTDFAHKLIDSIAEANLQVHPFKPIRDNVVRDGKEWVPAVIRYNKIPTRVLLEVCNLGNEEDRNLIKTKKYRQSVAEAVKDALIQFFALRQDNAPSLRVASKPKSAAK